MKGPECADSKLKSFETATDRGPILLLRFDSPGRSILFHVSETSSRSSMNFLTSGFQTRFVSAIVFLHLFAGSRYYRV
jgi:hypothetical protein